MATGGNQRNVDLAIGISTSGTEAVAGLRKSITDLGDAGELAAPEVQKLTNELDKLAAQQNSLAQFAELRREVASLGTQLDKAAADVDRFGAELPRVRQATEDFALAQREAGETVASIKANIESTKAELAALREEYPKGKRNVDDYRNASQALLAEINRLKVGLADARKEQAEIVTGARAAAAAEKELATAYSQAVKAAAELSGEFAKQNAALDASRAAIDAAGLAAKNLAFSQEIVRIGFNETNAAIEKSTATLKALTKAQEEFDNEAKLAAGFADAAARGQREAAAAEQQRIASVRALTTAIQQQGRAAQAALDQAFNATGVRSAQAIDAELRRIDESLNLIARSSKTSAADFDRAFNASRARVEALKAELAGLPANISAAAKTTNLLGDAFRQLTIYFSAFTIGQQFIDANAQLETLRRTLTVVTGSAQTASQQIAFLRKTADESGVAIGSITNAYSKFAASAVSAGVDLETVNKTFANVTKAAGQLGLSSEEVGGALNALGQIASKGKVSMEELGQQLGDRLPAVLATTARGLGITTAELTKLIQNGEVLGDANFFRAFSQGIDETFLKGAGRVEGLNASIGRLKTAFSELFTGEEGRGSAVAAGIDLITGAVKRVSDALTGIGSAVGGTFAGISNFVSTLQQGLGPIQAFREGVTTVKDGFVDLANRAPALLGALGFVIKAQTEGADSAQKAGAAQAQLAKEAAAAGLTVEQYSAKLKEANVTTDASTGGYIKLLAQYAAIRETTNALAVDAEKLAKAKQIETQQIVELAKASGDEERVRLANVAASSAYAVALENVATLRTREAALLQAEIDALRAEATARGGISEAIRKQLEDLEKKQGAAAAEAEKSRQAAEAAKNEANERAILAKTYQDNSGQLKELTAAYTESNKALAEANKQLIEGKITQEQYNEVARKNVEAAALFRDALSDVTDKLKAQGEVTKSLADVELARLNVQKAGLQAEIDVAKARGDEYTATQKTIELKRLEITIIEAKAAAQKAEALASIAVAEATRAELEASGKLTEVKRLQIDATIKAAQAKQLEADAMLKGTQVLKQQIENLQMYGTETIKTTKSSDDLRGATDRLGGSFQKVGGDAREGARGLDTFAKSAGEAARAAGSLSASLDARNKQDFSILGKNTDKDGFALDSSGNRISSQTQANIPEGGTFDEGAFMREVQRSLLSSNPWEVDPNRFVNRGPSGQGGAVVGGTGGGKSGTSPFGTYQPGSTSSGGGGGTPNPGVTYREETGIDGLTRVINNQTGEVIGIRNPPPPGVPGSSGRGADLQPVTIVINGKPTTFSVAPGEAGIVAELMAALMGDKARTTDGGGP